MIKGGFNFSPFVFLGACISVSLVFYVFNRDFGDGGKERYFLGEETGAC